jgi:hypothetical protein
LLDQRTAQFVALQCVNAAIFTGTYGISRIGFAETLVQSVDTADLSGRVPKDLMGALMLPSDEVTCPACLHSQVFVPKYLGVMERIILRFVRVHALQCHACRQRFYLPFLVSNSAEVVRNRMAVPQAR